MEFGGVGGHVVGTLVARRMFELDARKLLGDAQGRLHVAEGGREDQLVAGAGELLDGAVAVGLGHILEEGGLHLVLERLFHGDAALIMLIGIAEVADRADIDEADLELFGGEGGAGAHECGCGEQRDLQQVLFHSIYPSCLD